jgi:hypothetical protein
MLNFVGDCGSIYQLVKLEHLFVCIRIAGRYDLEKLKPFFQLTVVWLSRLYLLAFFVFAMLALPGHDYLVGTLLQQGFIAVMIILRLRRKTQLFFIPDEMLVCLPYFWALATLGGAVNWFADWQYFFLSAFALALLQLTAGRQGWFSGGLRQNSLLQAVYCALMFVLIFATSLRSVFPPFSFDLYRETIMNTVAFFAGIPICLAAAESRSST